WFAVRNSSFWEINPAREYGDDNIPYTVGDVCASDPGDTKGLQESNAHLISAAPDLYEALGRMRYEYRSALRKSGIDEYASSTMAIADEALAKARGET
ncbi:MAG: hypothetical protein GY766_05590, partial [Herbaspirillum sp.]|uniref:hypothetical protein n=1 Tax=Herbaspirillum sp. TaxID=1890675 RepID=UPI002586F02B